MYISEYIIYHVQCEVCFAIPVPCLAGQIFVQLEVKSIHNVRDHGVKLQPVWLTSHYLPRSISMKVWFIGSAAFTASIHHAHFKSDQKSQAVWHADMRSKASKQFGIGAPGRCRCECGWLSKSNPGKITQTYELRTCWNRGSTHKSTACGWHYNIFALNHAPPGSCCHHVACTHKRTTKWMGPECGWRVTMCATTPKRVGRKFNTALCSNHEHTAMY